jgi:hypothetical protein
VESAAASVRHPPVAMAAAALRTDRMVMMVLRYMLWRVV